MSVAGGQLGNFFPPSCRALDWTVIPFQFSLLPHTLKSTAVPSNAIKCCALATPLWTAYNPNQLVFKAEANQSETLHIKSEKHCILNNCDNACIAVSCASTRGARISTPSADGEAPTAMQPQLPHGTSTDLQSSTDINMTPPSHTLSLVKQDFKLERLLITCGQK